MEKKIDKIGYYTIFEKIDKNNKKYIVDSGKTIYIAKFKKYLNNIYRDVKEFKTLKSAKEYVFFKLDKHSKEKERKLKGITKSLYLVLIKEDKTGNTFVKVGFTSKRFIIKRFSKIYGYDGYTVESILRRVDTPDAENLESKIKEKIKKRSKIKKYRPLLESFSGYSECFEFGSLNDIIEIFDEITKKS